MSLTLGHIAYLNCVPFFHYLRAAGFKGKIVDGVPSELNRMLAAGEIDVSPSSSFEYGLNWEKYLLLPGMSISSFGAVKSVLLFSQKDLEQLEGEEIALTGESATSVNLLRLLLWEYVGLKEVSFRVPPEPIEEVIASGGAALLIGDRALKAAQNYSKPRHIFDLGELWFDLTGLPFVFALWILRYEIGRAHPESIHALIEQLQNSRNLAFADLKNLADQYSGHGFLNSADLIDYWRSMSYGLSEKQLEGLRFYFGLCRKYDLLSDEPETRIIAANGFA